MQIYYYVYKNFYNYITNGFTAGEGRSCWVLEAYFNLQEMRDELVQNSIMISTPWQSFWHRCMEDCLEMFFTYKEEYDPTNVMILDLIKWLKILQVLDFFLNVTNHTLD